MDKLFLLKYVSRNFYDEWVESKCYENLSGTISVTSSGAPYVLVANNTWSAKSADFQNCKDNGRELIAKCSGRVFKAGSTCECTIEVKNAIVVETEKNKYKFTASVNIINKHTCSMASDRDKVLK